MIQEDLLLKTTATTTYLRIRRKRQHPTASCLRVVIADGGGWGDDEKPALREDPSIRHRPVGSSSSASRCLVWRKIEHPPVPHLPFFQSSSNSTSTGAEDGKKRPQIRVIEVVLEEESRANAENEIVDEAEPTPTPKRRRLTWIRPEALPPVSSNQRRRRRPEADEMSRPPPQIIPETLTRSPRGYRVLDPHQRLIDDSLRQVFLGERMVREHLDLMEQQSTTKHFQDDYIWFQEEHGTVLHACAHWNQVEALQDLLVATSPPPGARRPSWWAAWAGRRDGRGCTAYDVALEAGHDEVSRLLAQYGMDISQDVYDFYCLETTDPVEAHPEDPTAASSGDEDPPLLCELHGGVGYWEESTGQLILEPALDEEEGARRDDEPGDEDEPDSNDEDWEGNDYPDHDPDADFLDDDEEYVGGGEDDRWERGEEEWDRHRVSRDPYGFDTPYGHDDDGDYDPAYGMYEPDTTEYDQEC